MSAGRIANQMRMQALLAMGKLGSAKFGLVSSYNPQTYEVKVRLQPEDIETGWIPLTPLMAGSGFGVYAGPSQGDQGVVLFQEGDKEAGFCVGFLNSLQAAPPTVQSGEVHVLAKTHGAGVTLLQDGSLNLSTGASGEDGDTPATVTLKPDGTITSAGAWTHTGTFHATDDITSEADITDHTGADGSGGVSMKTHRDDYNSHHHTDPQGGTVGPASPQAT